MAKLSIIAGQEAAFGRKLREIVAQNPADGTDVADQLNPFLENNTGQIKVYIDQQKGVTKIVLPSMQDLSGTLTVLSEQDQDDYLAGLGQAVLKRCHTDVA